jgi:iron(III) transport system ATP-binding protein
MAIIELSHVWKHYVGCDTPAVHNVSLTLSRGEFLVLLAPSGSGKTTLLRLIAGFESPDRGQIFIGGRDAGGLPPESRGVGMVFQDYALFPHLTVEKNIAFGLARHPPSRRTRKVSDIAALCGLSALLRRYPHTLSGGQQQRVALARALAPDPIIILLDEPFSHLDRNMRAQMRGEVTAILRQQGSSAIWVTHDHEEAFAIADKIAVLHKGVLEQCDVPDLLYHMPSTPFVAQFVGPADFVPGWIRGENVETEIGLFPNNTAVPGGTEVRIMIRPDDVDIVPAQDGAARILSRQFKGSENLYEVRLASGCVIHSSQHSLTVYPVGARVNLKLSVTHTVIFRGTDKESPSQRGDPTR